jgi:hypothetical protein
VAAATGTAKPRGEVAGWAGPRSRRDNQRREARDEGEGLEVHGRRAVGPRLLEVQPHGSLWQDAQPVVSMETLGGFPNLPAMVRGRQSRPAPHALARGGRKM